MTAATAITPITWRNTWTHGAMLAQCIRVRISAAALCSGTHTSQSSIRSPLSCVSVRPSGTYSEVTAVCGTEVVWLAVWKENDRCANSHLEAGENLPLGHCSSYPWLPRAFPSTPLTPKSLWQSSQPTSMATLTGTGLWEPQTTVSHTSLNNTVSHHPCSWLRIPSAQDPGATWAGLS